MTPYVTYSDSLKKKYGEKVYKIPVALPVTCPNRDGQLSDRGCIFCGSIGAGYEETAHVSITEQINKAISHIGPKYKAKKFIAYFLNFTSTYAPLDEFRKWVMEAASHPQIVALDVSTRPDCVHEAYLDILKEASETYDVDITVELGLQSSNAHTLLHLNRCHTVAEFIDASLRIGRYGFGLCTHLIVDLPWDDRTDVIEAAKLVSVLPVTDVKLHSLFVVRGTELEREVDAGEVRLLPLDEYVHRVVLFLAYVRPDMVMQRIVGRASGSTIRQINGGEPWWVVRDMVEKEMEKKHIRQGSCCHYMDGSAVQHFVRKDGNAWQKQ
jgi:radical SAM protein (TIGR01212 family)